MSGRSRKVIGIEGLTGTGKTTQIMKMINAYRHGKIFILDKFNEEKYKVFPELPDKKYIGHIKKGIYRYYPPTKEECLEVVDEISATFKKDGLIILEDASAYIPNKEYKPLMNIFAGRRHRGWDTIMTFHCINRTPPFCLEAFDEMVLFKTPDNPEQYLKASVQQPKAIIELYNRVEKHPDPFFFEMINLRKANPVTQ